MILKFFRGYYLFWRLWKASGRFYQTNHNNIYYYLYSAKRAILIAESKKTEVIFFSYMYIDKEIDREVMLDDFKREVPAGIFLTHQNEQIRSLAKCAINKAPVKWVNYYA